MRVCVHAGLCTCLWVRVHVCVRQTEAEFHHLFLYACEKEYRVTALGLGVKERKILCLHVTFCVKEREMGKCKCGMETECLFIPVFLNGALLHKRGAKIKIIHFSLSCYYQLPCMQLILKEYAGGFGRNLFKF